MLIAIDARAAQETYGGIPSYARAIVNSLISTQKGHTFVLFANSFERKTFDWLCRKSNTAVVRFRIPNVMLSCFVSVSSMPLFDKLVEKKLGKKIDLWFSPNLNFTALSKNCPHVITAHDLSYEYYPSLYSIKMRFWHRAVRPRKTFLSAAHIVAVSQNTKNDLISTYSLSPDTVSVVYHGIDNEYWEKPRFARETLDAPQKYILVSAASSPRKNVENCIKAFHSFKLANRGFSDVELIVTGAKKEKYADVRHTGFVSKQIYRALLWYAQALVYPSFYEGFGFPMVEAFASGTPVIASAHSSLSEIGADAFYPIDPYNTESITRAFSSVLSNQDVRNTLRQRGLCRAKQFSWENSAMRMISIFEKRITV